MQAYRPIILASQTVAADKGAQAGQRANRRGRDDDDEDGHEGDSSMGGGMCVLSPSLPALAHPLLGLNARAALCRNVDADAHRRTFAAPEWSGA